MVIPDHSLASRMSILSTGRAVLDSDSTTDGASEGDESRASWGNDYEYLFSCLLYVVGFGNLVRFPNLCYENGGGAFLVPYILSLLFIGIPIFYLELAIGQYASLGAVSVWNLSPAFKGIGYGVVLSSLYAALTYNVLISWAVYYFFASMQKVLPWTWCDPRWATSVCDAEAHSSTSNITTVLPSYNFTTEIWNSTHSTVEQIMTNSPPLMTSSGFNSTNHTTFNITASNHAEPLRILPAEEYFYRGVLKVTPDGFSNFGFPQWQLLLSLLAAWILVFVILIRGVRSAGKAALVLTPLPYIILTALLIENCIRDPEGAQAGATFYITPKWHLLAKPKVWYDAVIQVFFSLSIMQGGLITLSSYNKFHYNIYKAAIIIPVLDTLTSIYAGFTVFVILGVISREAKMDISEILRGSTGTAFITITEALSHMPLPQLWSLLYFLMLVCLGLGTEYVLVETAVTAMMDEYPEKLAKHRIKIVAGFTATLFVLGIPLICNGGVYLMAVVDKFSSSYYTMLLAIIFVICLAFVYKVKRLSRDIKSMVGHEASHYWTVMWMCITPLLLAAVLVISLYDYNILTYSNYYSDYTFPIWAELLGWSVLLTMVVPLPVVAVRAFRTTDPSQSTLKRIVAMTKPTLVWGPALEIHRLDISNFHNDNTDIRHKPKRNKHGSVKVSNDIGGLDSIFSATVGNNVIVKMATSGAKNTSNGVSSSKRKYSDDSIDEENPSTLSRAKLGAKSLALNLPITFVEHGHTYMLVPKKKQRLPTLDQATQTGVE